MSSTIEVVHAPFRKPGKASKRLSKPRSIPKTRKFPPKSKKRVNKPKVKKASVWDEFGLKRPQYVRYSGYGGVLWFLLSQQVRKEEFERYEGTCVDQCGVLIQDWHDADCGHFRSAKSLATRFLRENLGLQRKYCNSPRGGNGQQYAFGLEIDRRYGAGTADRLTELSKTTSHPFSKEWYRTQIQKYQSLLETK